MLGELEEVYFGFVEVGGLFGDGGDGKFLNGPDRLHASTAVFIQRDSFHSVPLSSSPTQ